MEIIIHENDFLPNTYLGFFCKVSHSGIVTRFILGQLKSGDICSCLATPHPTPPFFFYYYLAAYHLTSAVNDALGRHRNVIGRVCSSELDFISSLMAPPQFLLIFCMADRPGSPLETHQTLRVHTYVLAPPSSFILDSHASGVCRICTQFPRAALQSRVARACIFKTQTASVLDVCFLLVGSFQALCPE